MFVELLSTPSPAVTSAALADFLGVETTDPLLGPISGAATSAASQYLQRAITTSKYRVTFEYWPTFGPVGQRGLAPNLGGHKCALELPMTGPLVSIESVEANGEAVAEYTMSGGNPSKVRTAPAEGPIVIEYTTGWTIAPDWAQLAVLMLSAYMFEHRGQCDAQQALMNSGAAQLLDPYRVLVV